MRSSPTLASCVCVAIADKDKPMFRRILSRENLLALLLCLILILIVILTADQAPEWIYQGF